MKTPIVLLFVFLFCVASEVSAQVKTTAGAITTPEDARKHGLEDLSKAKLEVPQADLSQFLKPGENAKKALLQLGKALFWAEEVGSGGKAGIPGQACASCHFAAGADSRVRNQLNPNITRVVNEPQGQIVGLHKAEANPDTTFQVRQPNQIMRFSDFPFAREINQIVDLDVMSSQGVLRTEFIRTVSGDPNDQCHAVDDPVFKTTHGTKVRRVEPRHSPKVINAALESFFSFWDGRANPFFNGINSFGVQDPDARILVAKSGSIVKERIDIPFSSLASQAVSPPISDFEMSCGVPEANNARTWPEIGKKLLRKNNDAPIVPLTGQIVARNDSVLGDLSNYPAPGLNTTYSELIKKAFKPEYWHGGKSRVIFTDADVDVTLPSRPDVSLGSRIVNATPEEMINEDVVTEPENVNTPPLTENPRGQRFSLKEANFSLFFGLALQAYQQTLISDNTWFDRWMRNGDLNEGFGKEELKGLDVFVNKGRCINCHGGPELTKASVRNAQAGNNGNPNNLIEPMRMGDGQFAIYDNGFYNIGVTPTFFDIGRGGRGPTGAPLSSSRQRLFQENEIMKIPFKILGGDKISSITEDENEPVCMDVNNDGFCGLDEPLLDTFQRVAVDGAMKTPGLRVADLTGPYFHDGSAATLRQVVEFYDNGGNFCQPNIDNLDPDIRPIGLTNDEKQNLVKFLIALNDDRVRFEKAPFDHPSLTVANSGTANGSVIEIPAVGQTGRQPLGIEPLGTFLGINQLEIGNFPVDSTCSSNIK